MNDNAAINNLTGRLRMRLFRYLGEALIVVTLISLPGCGDSNPGANSPVLSVPIQELLNAPEQLGIDNYSFALETYLWRDFMPICPPDGQPLRAVAIANEIDSLEIPDSFNIVMMWVINGDKAWEINSPEGQYYYGIQPFQINVSASGGPKWGPRIYVTVVVQLADGDDDEIYLLKATNQYIGRTE